MAKEYIYNSRTILEQFRIFCKSNSIKNLESAVEFFAIFGGLNRQVDTTLDLKEQIKEHILRRYRYLRDDVANLTKGDQEAHKVLAALALGDRRTNSAFKRCNINFDDGIDIVDQQCDNGVLKLHKSKFKLANQKVNLDISEKLIFTAPFLHYWFACVSPIFKGVRDGDYKESLERFNNRKSELFAFTFEQLCHELVRVIYKDSGIETIGRYWDNSEDILKLIAKTKDGKIVVGSVIYRDKKAKSSDLNALIDTTRELGIDANEYIVFSKRGFSSELKAKKSSSVRLLSLKNLSMLLDN
jgi:hypothetical protein